ncbi:transglutaminase-like domain-containing protein [Frankia sp. EI5c]|uniref:transglutaminase-like domain-containing protein n=1 Tax=Frankia sp. EI5c TaxID=683316 RepID=UPI0037C1A858
MATDGALTPFQQAHQLEQYLRGLTYDPSAPAGHTYGHLAYFLGTSRTGTSEQFAASYAVLARLVGLPNRVVIGFSPKPVAAGDDARPGDAPNGAAHAGEVRTGDVLVWPEIHFEGLGWVPFYPTPAAAKDDSGQVATSAQGEPSERAQRVAEAAAVPAPTPTAAPAPPAAPAGGSGTLLLAALGAAALCAVGTSGYLVTAWAVPRLRRRRRRSRVSDARERVVGAWLDTLDALDVAGIPVPASATSAEIVTAVAAGSPVAADPASSAADPVSSAADPAPAGSPAAGGSSLTGLAALATVALFAGGEVSAADADTAWRQADQVRARLRRTTPRVRRIRRSLAPDRLRPRRRPTAAEPRRPRKAVRMSRGTGR